MNRFGLTGNAGKLLEEAQTDEQEVVWVLEVALKRAWWRLLVPMARVGWTSSTTECLTLRRAVGVVQPWGWLDSTENENISIDLCHGVSS